MKKVKSILILCVLLCAVANISANDETQIRERINSIEKVYSEVPKKQQNDSLVREIEYYRQLDTLLSVQIMQKDSILNIFKPYEDVLFVLSGDTSVFWKEYPRDINLPVALVNQYEVLRKITDARRLLVEIETKINQLTPKGIETLSLTEDDYLQLKLRVRSEIEGDMENVSKLLREIKEFNFSEQLSVPQYDYYKGLVTKYNQFVKIFK